ncbi:MAG: hypothetical protein DRI89_07325 [Bacteroidetes bacterium]|nr:MAG: hypothetical protein DRI89_07325 [Bacteroidota bacterium]
MKKIITLLAVFLMGTASVFAQYDVDVAWFYAAPFYCQSELTADYEFNITLEVYDVVNDEQVVLVTNTVDWDETGTTFTAAQTGIQDWCIKATKTPSLRISVLVEMALISDPDDVYCYKYGIQYNKTCNWFSSNTVSFNLTFN